ncbi:MAG TPA: hypothetical protein VK175_12310 [Leadbetterella sp.]|nr:hypothetical protein [Leadbetterella sp.]
MKYPQCILAVFLVTSTLSFSQVSVDLTDKTIALDYSTNVDLKKISGSDHRMLVINGEEISKIYLSKGQIDVKFGETSFKAMPEDYNIGVALVKDNNGKVVGMSKKYGKIHLVGIGNRIFKLERLDNQKQYKLWELQDGKSENKSVPKKILIRQGREEMEIFHNLEDIPITAIPFIINTKGVDTNISNKVLKGFLLTVLLTAMRVALASAY